MKILVVEGNTSQTSAKITAHGGTPYGEAYSALLQQLDPGTDTEIARPADAIPEVLSTETIRNSFDGVVWTGSAESVYKAVPAVTNQLAFADRVVESGVPVFGSCWGLQVFATVLGGHVRNNPRGREIGFAQEITLTDDGNDHPMLQTRNAPFNAFAVHMDEVDRLPDGAQLLAYNEMSDVQAFAYDRGGFSFWGVQYHPEFDDATMAATYRRLADALVMEGTVIDRDAAANAANAFDTRAQRNTGADPKIGRDEIVQWLAMLKARSAHGEPT